MYWVQKMLLGLNLIPILSCRHSKFMVANLKMLLWWAIHGTTLKWAVGQESVLVE